MSKKKIKIWHIITGLQTGGAETMLHKLLSNLNRDDFEPTVFSLMPINYKDPVPMKLKASNIDFYSLNLQKKPTDFLKIGKWMTKIYKEKPDIIQSWLYHANFLVVFSKIVPPFSKIIWNVRNESYKTSEGFLINPILGKVLSLFSNFVPASIIYVSMSALNKHIHYLGYSPVNSIFIPNGFELDKFNPSYKWRQEIRRELNISEKAKVILFPTRFNLVHKDIKTFFKAVEILYQQRKDVYFILCGKNMTTDNLELQKLKPTSVSAEHIKILGVRHDMNKMYNAADLTTLISFSEGFPNILGESMASGVPCVATPAGDSREIINDTGIIVPFKDPKATAEAWNKILSLPQNELETLKNKSINRIKQNYSILVVTKRYEKLYKKVLKID